MTAILNDHPLDFVLDVAHEAHEPPEARGPDATMSGCWSARAAEPIDARFAELGTFLSPGDLIVVNTSATIPAALDGRLPDGEPIVVHLSGSLPGDVSLVEVRRPHGGSTAPLQLERPERVELLGGGHVDLLAPFADSRRLWLAKLEIPRPVTDYLNEFGRPIRYRHVPRDWPLECYQTVFAREPGSAEMPSASRPFTHELVTDLVARGVLISPLLLHTGVSSLEGGERPYPERYRVPRRHRRPDQRGPARRRTRRRRRHHRRARARHRHRRPRRRAPGPGLDRRGRHPRHADDRGRRPAHRLARAESSHLMMLEAFADHDALSLAYRRALCARVPLARVRRQPPHPAPASVHDDAEAPRPTRRRCRPGGGRCSTHCAGGARRPPSRSPSSSA